MNTTVITNSQEAIASVIDGLCFLIINHAKCAASEQWSPRRTSDDSDDYIRDHSEWIGKLRKIREDFENLATGFIPRNEPSPTDKLAREALLTLEKLVQWKPGVTKTCSFCHQQVTLEQALIHDCQHEPPHGLQNVAVSTIANVATEADAKQQEKEWLERHFSHDITWAKATITNIDTAVRRLTWPTGDYLWLDKTGETGIGQGPMYRQQHAGIIKRYEFTPEDEAANDWGEYYKYTSNTKPTPDNT